jgi:hypothetical protein
VEIVSESPLRAAEYSTNGTRDGIEQQFWQQSSLVGHDVTFVVLLKNFYAPHLLSLLSNT